MFLCALVCVSGGAGAANVINGNPFYNPVQVRFFEKIFFIGSGQKSTACYFLIIIKKYNNFCQNE